MSAIVKDQNNRSITDDGNVFQFVQYIFARFLGILLVVAGGAKAWNPEQSTDSLGALLGVFSVEAPHAVLLLILVLLISIEIVIGVLVVLNTKAPVGRYALVLMYGLFLVSVIVFANWAPESGCGCGLSGAKETRMSDVVRSAIFFTVSLIQIPLWISWS